MGVAYAHRRVEQAEPDPEPEQVPQRARHLVLGGLAVRDPLGEGVDGGVAAALLVDAGVEGDGRAALLGAADLVRAPHLRPRLRNAARSQQATLADGTEEPALFIEHGYHGFRTAGAKTWPSRGIGALNQRLRTS